MATWYVDSNASSVWAANTAYSLGDRVSGVTETGVIFECTTAGTSGGSQPTWGTNPGSTTADGTATWTARAFTTSWSDAAQNLAWVDSLVSAGDTIYCEYRHVERDSLAVTFDFASGTNANPVLIYSVDSDDSDAYRAGAQVFTSTTGGDMSWRGPTVSWGLHFLGRSSSNSDARIGVNNESIVLNDANISFAGYLYTNQNCQNRFNNCVVNCDKGIAIAFNETINEFRGGQLVDPAVTIFNAAESRLSFYDVDMSSSTAPLAGHTNRNRNVFHYERCLFAPGWSIADFTTGISSNVTVIGCGDGTESAAVNQVKRLDFGGSTTSTDAIYRTGGANDGENTTSWGMVTTTNAVEVAVAHESPPIVRWVEAGSQTLTVYLAGGAAMNDDDFWVEISSPNETSSPNQTAQGNFRSTRVAPLATPAALTTDSSSTWNGSGVGTKQKIDVSINPTEPGPVTVRCFLAKPSTTVYVDPVIAINGNTSGDSYAVEGLQLNKSSTGGGGGLLRVGLGGGMSG